MNNKVIIFLDGRRTEWETGVRYLFLEMKIKNPTIQHIIFEDAIKAKSYGIDYLVMVLSVMEPKRKKDILLRNQIQVLFFFFL